MKEQCSCSGSDASDTAHSAGARCHFCSIDLCRLCASHRWFRACHKCRESHLPRCAEILDNIRKQLPEWTVSAMLTRDPGLLGIRMAEEAAARIPLLVELENSSMDPPVQLLFAIDEITLLDAVARKPFAKSAIAERMEGGGGRPRIRVDYKKLNEHRCDEAVLTASAPKASVEHSAKRAVEREEEPSPRDAIQMRYIVGLPPASQMPPVDQRSPSLDLT